MKQLATSAPAPLARSVNTPKILVAYPEYQRVVVPRERAVPYETEFFHCLGCSLMFIEPELFTEAAKFRKQQNARAGAAHDYGPNSGAPATALDQQALRFRIWKAKAQREQG